MTIRLILKTVALVKLLNIGISIAFVMTGISTLCVAQDLINVTGQWKTQPAISPDSLPKPLSSSILHFLGFLTLINSLIGRNDPIHLNIHSDVNHTIKHEKIKI